MARVQALGGRAAGVVAEIGAVTQSLGGCVLVLVFGLIVWLSVRCGGGEAC
jgi:hypothetical protein